MSWNSGFSANYFSNLIEVKVIDVTFVWSKVWKAMPQMINKVIL